jgi:hypothetical protein
VADALSSIIRSAARLSEFNVADADELVKYATRRGLLGQEEGDRLLQEVHLAEQRRVERAADREKGAQAQGPRQSEDGAPGQSGQEEGGQEGGQGQAALAAAAARSGLELLHQ